MPQHPAVTKPQPEPRGSRDSLDRQLGEMQRSVLGSPPSRSAPQPTAQPHLTAFTPPAPSKVPAPRPYPAADATLYSK